MCSSDLDIYCVWAESMQDLSIGAIQHGVELSKQDEHPPNLGKFMDHCRKYKPKQVEARLNKNPVSQEKAKENLEKLKKLLAEKLDVLYYKNP